MPKKVKELTALDVRRLTHATSKNGVEHNAHHPVGGVPGLLLQVTPSGATSWVLRTTIGVKRRNIGLGSYPAVSLADARKKAQEAKEQIALGFAR